MPMQQIWDNREQTAIRQVYRGIWSVEDFKRHAIEFAIMAGSKPYTVDYLFDFRHATGYTGNFLSAARHLEILIPSNAGQGVVIGGDVHMRAVLAVVAQMAPVSFGNLAHAETLPEARQILHDRLQRA